MKPRFITGNQLTALAIATVVSTATLILPTLVIMQAGQSAWLTPWPAFLLALGITRLIVKLHARYPGETLIEYAPKILGKPLGKLVGLLYVWWIFHAAATIVQEHSLFLDSTILIQTPAAIFYGSLVVFAVFVLWPGLHVITYLSQLLWPVVPVLVMVIVTLVAPHMEPGNLAPLISHGGFPDVLVGTLGPAGFLGEVVLLTMFLPYVKPDVNAGRKIAGALLVATFTLSLVLAAVVAVFNAEEAVRLQFPLHSLARYIFIGFFLNRLDALVVTAWVMGVAVKLTIWLLAGVLAVSQLTGLKSAKGILPAAAFFTASLSTLLYDNIAQMTTFLKEIWPVYAFGIFEAGLPFLMFLTALARKKKVGI